MVYFRILNYLNTVSFSFIDSTIFILLISNYPTISFSISKSNPLSGTPKVLVHSGIIPPSGNKFQVIWPASSGIRLQKTLASEDGTYQITITGL